VPGNGLRRSRSQWTSGPIWIPFVSYDGRHPLFISTRSDNDATASGKKDMDVWVADRLKNKVHLLETPGRRQAAINSALSCALCRRRRRRLIPCSVVCTCPPVHWPMSELAATRCWNQSFQSTPSATRSANFRCCSLSAGSFPI
jgi:hypothetical protein